MVEIFNGLISFDDDNKMNTFIETINDENAVKVIETAIEFATSNGIFNLTETYCLFKCLKKIKENE